jgi:hypothetical protein
VVHNRKSAARAPFVLLVAGLLAGGLVFVLLVNTWLAQGSFTVRQLQQEQSDLRVQSQAIAQKIHTESAPQVLAAKAQAMGFVPAPAPVFKTTSGKVLGDPEPGVRPAPPPPPSPSATPDASASASPSASPSTSPSPGASAATKPSARASTKPSAQASAKPKTTTSLKPAPPAPGGNG